MRFALLALFLLALGLSACGTRVPLEIPEDRTNNTMGY